MKAPTNSPVESMQLSVASGNNEILMTPSDFLLYPKYTKIFCAQTTQSKARFFMSTEKKDGESNLISRFLDTTPKTIITVDIDFTQELITLPQLCHLEQVGKPQSSINNFIETYTKSFNWFLQKLPVEEREPYCIKIMAGCSIEELFEKYPIIVSLFVTNLIVGTAYEVASSILDDFVTCFAKKMASIPSKLLEPPEFYKNQNLNFYLRLQNQRSSCLIRDGYQVKSIATNAEGLMNNPAITGLSKSETWQEKQRLIACLSILQDMATLNKNFPNLKKLVLSRMPKAIIEGLLQFDLFETRLIQNNVSFLERTQEIKATGIVSPYGGSLTWTHNTLKYLECDVVPSDKFLHEFEDFLKRCRTNYSASAKLLKEYLDTHSRPVNHPKEVKSESHYKLGK